MNNRFLLCCLLILGMVSFFSNGPSAIAQEGGAKGPAAGQAPWEKYAYPRKAKKVSKAKVRKTDNAADKRGEQKVHVEYFDEAKKKPKVWYQYREVESKTEDGEVVSERVLDGLYVAYAKKGKNYEHWSKTDAYPLGPIKTMLSYAFGALSAQEHFSTKTGRCTRSELYHKGTGRLEYLREYFDNGTPKLREDYDGDKLAVRVKWGTWWGDADSNYLILEERWGWRNVNGRKQYKLVYRDSYEYYTKLAHCMSPVFSACSRQEFFWDRSEIIGGGEVRRLRTTDLKGFHTHRLNGQVVETGWYQRTLDDHGTWAFVKDRAWNYYRDGEVYKTETWKSGELLTTKEVD